MMFNTNLSLSLSNNNSWNGDVSEEKPSLFSFLTLVITCVFVLVG